MSRREGGGASPNPRRRPASSCDRRKFPERHKGWALVPTPGGDQRPMQAGKGPPHVRADENFSGSRKVVFDVSAPRARGEARLSV